MLSLQNYSAPNLNQIRNTYPQLVQCRPSLLASLSPGLLWGCGTGRRTGRAPRVTTWRMPERKLNSKGLRPNIIKIQNWRFLHWHGRTASRLKKKPKIKIILFYFLFQSQVIYGWFYLHSPVNHPLRILGLKFQICVNYCKCQVSNLTVKPQIIEIIASVSPVYTTCETQSSAFVSCRAFTPVLTDFPRPLPARY